MNDAPRTARMVAEIRYTGGSGSISYVGKRPIHQFWTLLGPNFRNVWLAPQRRSDGAAVRWMWTPPSDAKEPSATELAELRKRMADANRRFAENPFGWMDDEGLAGGNSEAVAHQVRARAAEIVSFLSNHSDAGLAAYVCRTETGLRIHSWGSTVPAAPYDPASQHCGVSGTVLVGSRPGAGHIVILENARGEKFAESKSDAQGRFSFEEVYPGSYRVRVVSDRVPFPSKGVSLRVEQDSVTGLELHSSAIIDEPESPAPLDSPEEPGPPADPTEAVTPASSPSPVPRHRRRRSLLLLLLLLVSAGGSLFWWLRPTPPAAARIQQGRISAFQNRDHSIPSPTAHKDAGSPAGGDSSGLGGSLSQRASQTVAGRSGPAPHVRRVPLRAPEAAGSAGDAPSPGGSADGGTGDPLALGMEGVPSGPPMGLENKASPPHRAGAKPKAAAAQKASRDPAPIHPADTAKEEPDGTSARADSIADGGATRPEASSGTDNRDETDPTRSTAQPISDEQTPPANEKRPEAEPMPGHRRKLAKGGGSSQLSAGATSAGPADRRSEERVSRPPAVGSPDAAAAQGMEDAPTGVPASNGPGRVSPAGEATPSPDAAPPSSGVPSAATESGSSGDGDSLDAPTGSTPADRAGTAGSSRQPRTAIHGSSASDAPARTGLSEPGKRRRKRSTAPGPASSPPPSAQAASAVPLSEASSPTAEGSAPVGDDAAPPAEAGADPEASADALAAETAARPDEPASDGPEDPDAASSHDEVKTAAPASPWAPLPEVEPAPSEPSHEESPDGDPRRPSAKAEQEADGRADAADQTMAPGQPKESESPSAGAIPPRATTPVLEVTVQFAPWETRIARDVILPTRPMKAGTQESLEALRKHTLQAAHGRMPDLFRHLDSYCGIVLWVDAAMVQQRGALQWTDGRGTPVPFGSIAHQRAEIGWTGNAPPRPTHWVLRTADGTEIASLIAADSTPFQVRMAPHTRAWLWLGLKRPESREAESAVTEWSERLRWRSPDGQRVPAGWIRDDRWLGGKGHRLAIPLHPVRSGSLRRAVTLVDEASGWSGLSAVELR